MQARMGGEPLTRRDAEALVVQVAAEAQRLAPRLQRTPHGMAAVQKLDPSLLMGICVHVSDLHEQFKLRGSCPLLRVVVADIVGRMRGCVRADSPPLTEADVRLLSLTLEADIKAALRRLADRNAAPTATVLVGGATWAMPSLFSPRTWFRKPTSPRASAYTLPSQRPLLTIPLLHPDAEDSDEAHIACAVLNTATITLCAAAAIALSPVIVGLYLGRRMGIKQMKAEPGWLEGHDAGRFEGYRTGYREGYAEGMRKT